MKPLPRWLLGLGFLGVVACGSADDADSGTTPGDLESRLAADTGARWLVERDEAGAPLFLSALSAPRRPSRGMSLEQAAREFLQRYADVFGAGDLADELILRAEDADVVAPGVHRLRFTQRIPGSDVRVFGADTFVHFDADGAIRFAAVGLVGRLASIRPTSITTAEQARAVAEGLALQSDPHAQLTMPRAPELVVHRVAGGRGALAWRVLLVGSVGGALSAPEVFVDALTGAVRETNDAVAHASRTKSLPNAFTYNDCGLPDPVESTVSYDDAAGGAPLGIPSNELVREGDGSHTPIVTKRFTGFSTPPLPIVASSPDSLGFYSTSFQGNGAAVSAQANLAITDAYFRKLGTRGWDDSGATAIAVELHARYVQSVNPLRFAEADGYTESKNVIYLGDGASATDALVPEPNCNVLPSGVALDVVSHEFTHGVVAHRAHLGNTGEAGAVNEGLADVLGAGVEHSVDPGDHNFTFGEKKWLNVVSGKRSMRAPRSFPSSFRGEQMPRARSEILSTVVPGNGGPDNDRGHVHDNSTIVSHAYYLMTVGGTNDVSKVTIAAGDALGWDASQRLWHTTLYSLDRAFARSIKEFARVNVAIGLFTGRARTVACAWRAVEVFDDAELALFGISCDRSAPQAPPPPPAPNGGSSVTCAGHGDNAVCDPAARNSAFVCKRGAPVGVALCADLGQACKPASSTDPTATLGADGALVCE